MLEPIDAYLNNTECQYSEYYKTKEFLLYYLSENGCKFIDELKLLNMLRYYKLYDKYDIDEIDDFGDKFKELHHKFIELENYRLRYYRNTDKIKNKVITNPVYLTFNYKKLKNCLRNKDQYTILKETILFLSPIDTKYFINILLRKYNTNQIKDIVKLIENGN